jgi:hypothetical protein
MNLQLQPNKGRRLTLMAGGSLLPGLLGSRAAAQADMATSQPADAHASGALPADAMQKILRSDGTVKNGVLSVEQNRDDLDNVTGPHSLPWKPAFEIQNELHFQPIGPGRAMFNGDVSLVAQEINPVIDAILKNGLVFQALHQHFFDEKPQLWHVHFRGTGAPLALARAVANVIAATATPLPQTSPAHPTSPLDASLIAQILGGDAEIGEEGTVHASVARKEDIVVAGVHLKPEMGVEHTIAFEPLGDGRTVVAPDFALIAAEVNPVMTIMRKQGFEVHCLYNQETAESPQLYFSHQLAVGDAYALARAVRRGLEKTNADFK